MDLTNSLSFEKFLKDMTYPYLFRVILIRGWSSSQPKIFYISFSGLKFIRSRYQLVLNHFYTALRRHFCGYPKSTLMGVGIHGIFLSRGVRIVMSSERSFLGPWRGFASPSSVIVKMKDKIIKKRENTSLNSLW